ncbi:MAG TPA: hypothetical protein VLJ17_09110 [Xanthobacteraceae bacterium]|nr:hypothetical protein [Xanthobacteraceae bacterium]
MKTTQIIAVAAYDRWKQRRRTKEMPAALDIDIPNDASAVVGTDEIVASLFAL